MTADIVNLRRARKTRERALREKQAEANRNKFGRTKAERQQKDAETALEAKRLDGLKRTPENPTTDDGDGAAT